MHVDHDDVARYLRGLLEEPRSARIESHLRCCESCAQKLADDAKFVVQLAALGERQVFDTAENDRKPQIPADTPAYVRIFNPFCPDRFAARVIEISGRGFKIGFARSLQPGTVIQLYAKPLHILGEVRCCIPSPSAEREFWIGAEIQDIYGS